MAISSDDIIPLGQVRGRLSEIADEVREHIHLSLLAEVEQGLDDLNEGQTITASALRQKFRK
jgi:hypothetical protein